MFDLAGFDDNNDDDDYDDDDDDYDFVGTTTIFIICTSKLRIQWLR